MFCGHQKVMGEERFSLFGGLKIASGYFLPMISSAIMQIIAECRIAHTHKKFPERKPEIFVGAHNADVLGSYRWCGSHTQECLVTAELHRDFSAPSIPSF